MALELRRWDVFVDLGAGRGIVPLLVYGHSLARVFIVLIRIHIIFFYFFWRVP